MNFRRINKRKEYLDWKNKFYSDQLLEELYNLVHSDSAISYYFGNKYREMNKMIRKGLEESDSNNDCIQPKKAKEEINKYQIPDSIHVTRFVSIQEWIIWFLGTIHKKEYIHKGFVSTTLIKDLFSSEEIKRDKVMIGINIPKGTKGILVPEISERNPEYEILLPYYTKFKRVSWNEYKVVGYIDKLK